jgi:hypothetical protein
MFSDRECADEQIILLNISCEKYDNFLYSKTIARYALSRVIHRIQPENLFRNPD